MQFIVIGMDGDDSEAMNRRLASREAHLKLGDQMEAEGTRWYGAAITDDNGVMIGSMAVLDFTSEEELKDYLKREPYVKGDVWRTVEVHHCNVKNPWKFNRPKEFFLERGYVRTT